MTIFTIFTISPPSEQAERPPEISPTGRAAKYIGAMVMAKYIPSLPSMAAMVENS